MMDLKGAWKCRNGFQAYITEFKDGYWEGTRDYTGFNSIGTHAMPTTEYWDESGHAMAGRISDANEWDLMERLSGKWSSERALG